MALLGEPKTVCHIPLVNRGRALGMLAIGRTAERPYDADEVEFLSQVAGQIAIAIENALAYEEISELRNKLAQEKVYLEEEIRSEMGFEQIIGGSAALKHVLQLVETVAPSDSTVLLLGESGTGKELFSRAIHFSSGRAQKPFIAVNCGAVDAIDVDVGVGVAVSVGGRLTVSGGGIGLAHVLPIRPSTN